MTAILESFGVRVNLNNVKDSKHSPTSPNYPRDYDDNPV